MGQISGIFAEWSGLGEALKGCSSLPPPASLLLEPKALSGAFEGLLLTWKTANSLFLNYPLEVKQIIAAAN